MCARHLEGRGMNIRFKSLEPLKRICLDVNVPVMLDFEVMISQSAFLAMSIPLYVR